MLIDWFTVGAQALNFLILVWLLKRFLYKPILNAVDAREKLIATELSDARAKVTEAQKERDDFQHKNEVFDQQRAALFTKATDDAKAERQRLLDEARKAADALSTKRQDALRSDFDSLGQAIRRRTQDEVFAVARKALSDLATTDLEERIGDVFMRRLIALDDHAKAALGEALKTASEPALVRSAFDLPAEQRAAIQNALNVTFSMEVRLRFETAQDLVGGIELTTNGQKLAWSIADYLTSLEDDVAQLLSAKTKPEPKTLMTSVSEDLAGIFDGTFAAIDAARDAFTAQLTPHEIGTITNVSTGIALVSGLRGVGSEELLEFPGGVFGIAFNLDEDEIGVVLLGDYWHLNAGDEVKRTGRVMDVGVGDGLLGRVVDPLGRALDDDGPVASSARLPIERPAAAIMDRAQVTVPLQTGLIVIDALIPIGRGQRELILGDRQTGKTAIAIDTILNQRGQNVVCVYCAIGQRASAVAKAIANLRQAGAMEYTVVVVAEGNDAPGLAYIAPYAATSIAEYFMGAGRDVLIVYDDLTHHARAYRELSLLLRRPPGREAFPGDIFYIHSRMLERATRLRTELGGGSLTALPIIETEAQNISAYIPTNLISITDGQIYLSPSLFELGVLPAVDVGMSVSRVGGKAQRAAYRAVAGDLKLAYAQFEELETFARFGARLDDDTRKIIEHGRRIRACLKQPELSPVSVPAQITVLLALTAELFDVVALDRMTDAQHAVHEAAGNIPAEISARFESAEKLSDEDRKAVIEIARRALASFQPKTEGATANKADPASGVDPKTAPATPIDAKAKARPAS